MHEPGVNRQANAMLVAILINAHRPSEDKQKLLGAITRCSTKTFGFSPDDVFIVPNV
jgi:phenylpyruvate tautomerase PptA (4-oxalocrotonate tautomerase family)